MITSPVPPPDVVTVNENPVFTVRVVAVVPGLIVRLAHVAATAIDTLTPSLITTSSADVGTDAPPQVAVLFQGPLTEAVLV
jgi:hypothetical protein